MILKENFFFFFFWGGGLMLDDYDRITCRVVKRLLFFLQSESKYHFVAAKFKQIASVINLFPLVNHANLISISIKLSCQNNQKTSLWANSLVC